MGEWRTVGTTETRSYLARPESGSGPGVLVLHAWWGLTEVFTDVCDRLAAAGFVAYAPSLYADNVTTDSIERAGELVGSDQQVTEELMLAGFDDLRALPGVTGSAVGVIGFSMGANWALHLSAIRPDEVAAAVTVYGLSDADFSKARAAYLGHFADNDDYEPIEMVPEMEAAMRAAGREVTIHVYPGQQHWFAESNRPDVYDADAANLVWQRSIEFFRQHLT